METLKFFNRYFFNVVYKYVSSLVAFQEINAKFFFFPFEVEVVGIVPP